MELSGSLPWSSSSSYAAGNAIIDTPHPPCRAFDQQCSARFHSWAAVSRSLSWQRRDTGEPEHGEAHSSDVLARAAPDIRADGIQSTVAALRSRGRFPRKWLGQHFSLNEGVNARVVETAEVRPGDLVLEIGPGTGSLTRALVDAGARVIAVEKDPDMASLIGERFPYGQVQVVQSDFLKWPVASELAKLLPKGQLAKVVSNLPFNITTDVVKRILPLGDIFSRVVLLLQDEAALRLTSQAPAPDQYRAMTILVNFFAVTRYKGKVSRKCFFPAPRVDGGIVAFDLKKESEYLQVGDVKIFLSMIKSAFNGKRKMLRNSLQHMFSASDIEAALLLTGLPVTARPGELTVEEFAAFYGLLPTSRQKQVIQKA